MDERFRFLLIAVVASLMGTVYLYFVYRYFFRRRLLMRSTPDLLRVLLPALVASIAGMTVFWVYFVMREARGTRDADTFPLIHTGSTLERLGRIEDEVAQMRDLLRVLAPADPNQKAAATPAELAKIEAKLVANAEAIKKFESLLLSDAERLVTLPLLQRDFQGMKEELASTKEMVVSMRTLLSEAGGQNRWVIGTLALGMLALVVPAVRSLLAPPTPQTK